MPLSGPTSPYRTAPGKACYLAPTAPCRRCRDKACYLAPTSPCRPPISKACYPAPTGPCRAAISKACYLAPTSLYAGSSDSFPMPDTPVHLETTGTEPTGFEAQVLPRLLDAAFGSDDGWKKEQWWQFWGALTAGTAVAVFGGMLVVALTLTNEPRHNEQVVMPFATGLVGTGLGLIGGACAVNGAGAKGSKKQ